MPVIRDDRLHYHRWLLARMLTHEDFHRQRLAVHHLAQRPLISVITPVYNTQPNILRRMLASVKYQTYPFWELCLVDDGSSEEWITPFLEREAAADTRILFRHRGQNGGIVAASNDALALATGEYAAFVDHDDVLEPQALYEVVRTINDHPDADVVHSDFDFLERDGVPTNPALWPAWSPERLQTMPYTVHLRVYRRSCIAAVGGFRAGFDGGQDYDLALRLSEQTQNVVHIPQVLYHWRAGGSSAALNAEAKPYAFEAASQALSEHLERMGLPATRMPAPILGMHGLRFDGAALPPVSIVAAVSPCDDDQPAQALEHVAACLCSLTASADVQLSDIVVAAPERWHADLRKALSSLPTDRWRLVPFPAEADAHDVKSQPADRARALNTAARHATGDLLLVIGEDLEAISDAWMSQLAGYAYQKAIGAAGPKIFTPNDTVAHAGIVLPRGRPRPVHAGDPHGSYGRYGALALASNYTAVSGACLMTRRSVFDEVGGFRSAADVGHSDVDYCLRLRARGYRNVFTGYAVLRQLALQPPLPAEVEEAQFAAFRAQWPLLPDVDEYYNPNFDQESGSFRLGPA